MSDPGRPAVQPNFPELIKYGGGGRIDLVAQGLEWRGQHRMFATLDGLSPDSTRCFVTWLSWALSTLMALPDPGKGEGSQDGEVRGDLRGWLRHGGDA